MWHNRKLNKHAAVMMGCSRVNMEQKPEGSFPFLTKSLILTTEDQSEVM